MTTTDIFNFFHDNLKDTIEPHWLDVFCRISGIEKTIANDCYWNNKEIENDDTANQKLMKYICSLGYNCMLCSRVSWERNKFGNNEDCGICDIDNHYIGYIEETGLTVCGQFKQRDY